MRILQINLVCRLGSTGQICDSIARHLIKEGHEVLNCSVEGLFGNIYEYKYETAIEELLRRVCFKIWGRKQWQSILQTLRLINKIKSFNPDVVHIHNIHHNVVNFQMLFEALAKMEKPIVYTLHDMWGMTGGCFHDSAWNCSGKKNSCQGCRMIFGNGADCDAKYAQMFLKKKSSLYQKQQKICFVAVSEWLKRESDNSFIASFRREVIRNGISDLFIKGSNKDVIASKKIFVQKKVILSCASYWMEQKGLQDFFELASILGDEYQIVLVGNYDKKIKGTNKKIIFWGNENEIHKLVRLYYEADVYVSFSRCETYGLTLAEAACCGIPIVAYDNTGMSEVIDIAHGHKISNGNVKEAAQVIENICNCSNEKKEDEIKEICSQFSCLKMCEEYVEIYKSML